MVVHIYGGRVVINKGQFESGGRKCGTISLSEIGPGVDYSRMLEHLIENRYVFTSGHMCSNVREVRGT